MPLSISIAVEIAAGNREKQRRVDECAYTAYA